MAIKLVSTKNAARESGVKITVYGPAGSGKTRLCATTGEPTLIISAEAGLMSLRDFDIDVAEVTTIEQVHEVYRYLSASEEGKKYKWVCLDSISEIAEVVLAEEKKDTKDPRKAYGVLQDKMYDLIRAFRDLPGRNVYFSAKMLAEKHDIIEQRVKGALTVNEVVGQRMSYGPSLPGTKLGQALPYFTDMIFCLRVERDAEGNPSRWLQTQPDESYVAKDRSGVLLPFEQPDLAAIAAKVTATTNTTTEQKGV